MTRWKLFFPLLVISALCFMFSGCGPTTLYVVNGNQPRPLYLKNNIHSQFRNGEYRASYANWVGLTEGHVIIPVNTIVEIDYSGKYFIIRERGGEGRTIEVEYDESRKGMNTEQYLKLITSTETVSFDGFSDIDRKGLADGKPYMGMTKNGIRVALGYPATHRTPSLNSDTWIYWRNRWGTLGIDFDSSGKVVSIR